MIDPCFEIINGKEVVEVASYVYKAVEDVEAYCEPKFPKDEVNNVYKLTMELKEIPEIPNGHRIIILDDTFTTVWDSMYKEEYTPISKGWIIFV